MKVKADKYNEYLNLYDEYFVPLSCRKITNISSFLKDNNIANLEVPNVVKLIDITKNNTCELMLINISTFYPLAKIEFRILKT
jgi:hypothetical protein